MRPPISGTTVLRTVPSPIVHTTVGATVIFSFTFTMRPLAEIDAIVKAVGVKLVRPEAIVIESPALNLFISAGLRVIVSSVTFTDVIGKLELVQAAALRGL